MARSSTSTNVTGAVALAGGTLTLAGAFTPVVGDTFPIIANDGADAVTGTFAGLAEGAQFAVTGRHSVHHVTRAARATTSC